MSRARFVIFIFSRFVRLQDGKLWRCDIVNSKKKCTHTQMIVPYDVAVNALNIKKPPVFKERQNRNVLSQIFYMPSVPLKLGCHLLIREDDPIKRVYLHDQCAATMETIYVVILFVLFLTYFSYLSYNIYTRRLKQRRRN